MQEGSTAEFKEGFTKAFLKTVSAYANYGTGTIYFGIDDTGNVVGLDNPEKTALQIEHSISDSIDPLPQYSLDIENRGKHRIIRLRVIEGEDKPYYCHGKAYRRMHTSTAPVTRTELNRLVALGQNFSFEEAPSADQNLTFSLLDTRLKTTIGIDEVGLNTYKTLELYTTKSGFNNAGALLADKNEFFGIDMVRFGDSLDILMDRKESSGVSVLQQYDEALSFFQQYYEYEKITGKSREHAYSVPEKAYREAIANALVHRAWDIKASIRVGFYKDRVEISSPGGLPAEISEDEYLNGRLSVLRNPILAGVFFRLGYVERFGTGVPRIKRQYDDSLMKPQFEVSDNTIFVILPVVDHETSLAPDDKRILELLNTDSPLLRSEISGKLNLERNKTIRLLNSLIERGLIKKQGAARSVKYYV